MDARHIGVEERITGITGGIGAGKSVVSRILRLSGYPVYDCDFEARRIMEEDERVAASLVGVLGDAVYLEDGRLNRSLMARLIFSDDSLRTVVNGIVHKAVKADFLKWAAEKEGPVFVESAILATSGLEAVCSRIWLVAASDATRVARVKIRSGMKEKDIQARIDSQKCEFSSLPSDRTVVVDNGGEGSLLLQIRDLLEKQIKQNA